MGNQGTYGTILCILLATLFVTVATPTSAKKYKCERVQSIARLGVPSGSKVTIEDGARDDETGGPYCAFAVNGVAASSPPLGRVLQALDRLPLGVPNDLSVLVADVAYALIAAGTVEEPPSRLQTLLNENAKSLSNCLISFTNRSPLRTVESFGGGPQGTRGFCTFADDASFEDTGFAATLGIPSLIVFVADDETDVRRWFIMPARPDRR